MKKDKSSLQHNATIYSYIIVYFIPMAILSVLIFQIVFFTFREKIETINIKAVSDFTEKMDNEFLVMENVVYDLSKSDSLLSSDLNESGYNLMKDVEKLKSYKMANPIFTDIGIYFSDSYLFKCASGTYQPEYFCKFKVSNYSIDQVKKIILADKIQIVEVEDDTGNKELLCTFPIELSDASRQGTVFFILDLYTIAKEYIPYDISSIKMLLWNFSFDYNRPVYKIGIEESTFDFPEEQISHIEYNNIKNLAFRSYSSIQNFGYLFLFNQNELYKEVYQVRNICFIVFLLCLIFSLVSVKLFVKINYMPLQHLFALCSNMGSENNLIGTDSNQDSKEKANKISVIENTLSAMEKKINKQVMLDMVTGSVENFESVLALAIKLDVFRQGWDFGILVFEADVQIGEVENCLKNYTNSLPSKIITSVIEDKTNKNYLLICSFEKQAEKNFSNIVFLISKLTTNITIGISMLHNDLAEISKTYLEASTALNYKFVKGRNKIISFEEIKSETDLYNNELKNLVYKFSEILMNNNTEDLKHYPQNILNCLKTENISLYQAKKVSYDLIDTVIKYSIKNGINYKDWISINYNFVEISSFDTIDQVVKLIEEIIPTIIIELDLHYQKQDLKKANEIKEYICRNLADKSFSLNLVAEHFNMSYSSLCKYYKKHFNVTILNFVNDKRIENAKSLLTETHLLVKDIAEKVGYENSTSFNRIFKKHLGISPTEYRKINQKEVD